MKRIIIASGFVFVFVLSCLAADLNGLWKGTVKIPNRDDIELTYKLKTEGEVLTGSVLSEYGEIPLLDGKIKGDYLSFKMEIGEYTVEQTGKLYDDSLVIRTNFRGSDLQATFKKIK